MTTSEWRYLPTMADVSAAQAAGDEIQFRAHETYEWRSWMGKTWDKDWLFSARPAQPKMKKVKLFGYLTNSGMLMQVTEDYAAAKQYTRVPSEDKEIEVPE